MTTTLVVLLIAGMLWCLSVLVLGIYVLSNARASPRRRADYIIGCTTISGATVALGLHIWKLWQALS